MQERLYEKHHNTNNFKLLQGIEKYEAKLLKIFELW